MKITMAHRGVGRSKQEVSIPWSPFLLLSYSIFYILELVYLDAMYVFFKPDSQCRYTSSSWAHVYFGCCAIKLLHFPFFFFAVVET